MEEDPSFPQCYNKAHGDLPWALLIDLVCSIERTIDADVLIKAHDEHSTLFTGHTTIGKNYQRMN